MECMINTKFFIKHRTEFEFDRW